jgi:N-acetylmuramoyl-L-alanine amidase
VDFGLRQRIRSGGDTVTAMFFKRHIWGCVLVALACAGCGGGAAGAPAQSAAITANQPATVTPEAFPPNSASTAPQTTHSPSPSPTATPKPLAGEVVGIDPGHDGGNFDDSAYIGQQVWNGREYEDCDTTGTETDSGYTEAQFNFNVATYLRADLIADGARVVMTRSSNRGVGPCVTTRAQIIDRAHADVAVDIHGDGGPPGGRGFTVLEPVADGPNDGVISSSIRFGADVKAAMLAHTSMPASDYYGAGGVIFRDDLAGLNLTTVPKILIECGNMRNATDAALLIQPGYQREIARALTDAILKFLGR